MERREFISILVACLPCATSSRGARAAHDYFLFTSNGNGVPRQAA
ncbi:MAG: hypothetical protein ACRD21_18215 [Vicinamibacteria bacterium]